MPEQNYIYQISQEYIKLLYQEIANDSLPNIKRQSIAETSGEILIPAINKILPLLTLNKNDVFFDLGSGMGKVVVQFFLQTKIKKACGIEIMENQHILALKAAKRLKNELPDFYQNERELHFIHGSFLDISFKSATVILIGSPCFTPVMLETLGDHINSNSGIHTVISLRPLINQTRLPLRRMMALECTWDTALGFIYSSARL